MTRAEIIARFRAENPKMTKRVVTSIVANNWCYTGDKEVAAFTRCIQGSGSWTTVEDEQSWLLTEKVPKFFDIDDNPGGGVAYDDKNIKKTTKSALDWEARTWRSRTSGIPKKWFRRGNYLWLDRPCSEAVTLDIDVCLVSDDFDDDSKTPFNGLTYLEPFHQVMVLFLQKKAQMLYGDDGSEGKAEREYLAYVKWMKKELSGGKFHNVYLQPKNSLSGYHK